MSRIARLLILPAIALMALGAQKCVPSGESDPRLEQVVVHSAGVVEPNTPGAPGAVTPARVTELLGAGADLNRVTTVRTRLVGETPRVIVILIPGFLGGATTFDPIARDLVRQWNGQLEVWAVDRRPNQLEDRLGGRHALTGALDPDCQTSPPMPTCTIFEGAMFYNVDTDVDPIGDFPGPGDIDIDLDGVFDAAPTPLVDDFGVSRGPIVFSQDELRPFFAHWGIDLYMRDWKTLVDEARAVVGPNGLVLFGGHSQGTSWTGAFAAYDFDPSPGGVLAGHSLVDGLLLLEGGGIGAGAPTKPTLAAYQQTIVDLETPGGPNVFLSDFQSIPLVDLGTAGEVAAVAGFFQPSEPSLIQRTPTFSSGLVGVLLSAPATNRAIVGLFLDDDFSPIGAFRASFGFSDNGANNVFNLGGTLFYAAQPANDGSGLRQWLGIDDPLPTCPPNLPGVSPGCAILDNGPPSDPNDPLAPAVVNGVEAEVTTIGDFLRTQFGKGNGFEWYFVDGRVSLDFGYGRDSSALVAESLLATPGDEGPLNITQNANVDVPVLGIGGSNGLVPEAKRFDGYYASIATPAADKRVVIIEGYAHLDVINARDNLAVPPITDWIGELLQRKLLASF